ncbi:hypothetical protein HPB50_020071 [Hyalomma asiaticum]|uniref:Uncharacterized protein n=1 Tax=Hyalomma asiaticum TaxID=266040 RepID=A0ACB7S9W7_HYAAI|nr:hypothetical protein HPB50_020071 [Hyalomma asiaticum]
MPRPSNLAGARAAQARDRELLPHPHPHREEKPSSSSSSLSDSAASSASPPNIPPSLPLQRFSTTFVISRAPFNMPSIHPELSRPLNTRASAPPPPLPHSHRFPPHSSSVGNLQL